MTRIGRLGRARRTPVRAPDARSASTARIPSSVKVGGIRMSTIATSGASAAMAAANASASPTAATTSKPASSRTRVSAARNEAAVLG